MILLKQSTSIDYLFWAGDTVGTAVTGKVTGDWTKRIAKNGAAFGAMTVTVTEFERGWYGITLDTGHTDTAGVLTITFVATGVVQVNLQFRVHSALFADIATTQAAHTTTLATLATSSALSTAQTTLGTLATSSALSTAQTAITANGTAIAAVATTQGSHTTTLASLATSAALATLSTAVAAIPAGVLAAVTEGSRTVKGVLRRLDALVTGKATGLIDTVFALYAADGVTKLVEATQDPDAGTRTTASTVAGE